MWGDSVEIQVVSASRIDLQAIGGRVVDAVLCSGEVLVNHSASFYEVFSGIYGKYLSKCSFVSS